MGFRDWFNRKEENNYSYYDSSRRLISWDTGYKNYSDFLVDSKRGKKGIQDVASILNSMLRVMGVSKDTHFTGKLDGSSRKLQLPINLLRNKETGNLDITGERVDAFYGKSVLNASLQGMTSTDKLQYVNAVAKAKKNGDLQSMIRVLLDDERIHRELSENYPGYSKFAQKYKEHIYEGAESWLAKPASSELEEVVQLLTMLIRYPKDVPSELLEKYSKLVDYLQRIFNKFDGIPKTAEETDKLTKAIYNTVIKYVDESTPPPSTSPDDKGESEDDSSDDGDGTDESDSEDDKDPSDKRKETRRRRTSLSKDFASAVKDVYSELIEESTTAEEDQKNEEVAKTITDEIKKAEDASKFMSPKDDKELEKSGIHFILPEGDSREYTRIKSKVDMTKAQVLKKLLSRKSKDYDFALKSMRSGRLDTNKIAEAVQHVPTIYERIGHVKTDKICIGVLIDESGSMCGSEIEKAKEAAVFINEALGKLPDVELFIYGHSADQKSHRSTEIYTYREPGKSLSPHALGSCRARCENRDGVAILETAKRIRKFTSNNGVLFVLSDGAPAASGYGGGFGIRDTKEKVNQVEKTMGFQVIQIAINNHVPSEEMFNHFVKMTDIKRLPIDMVNYLSKHINRLVKEKYTM